MFFILFTLRRIDGYRTSNSADFLLTSFGGAPARFFRDLRPQTVRLESIAKNGRPSLVHHAQRARLPQPAGVLADRVMIEQVRLNPIRNGMDAMAGSSAEKRRLQIDTRADGEDVQVAVRDSDAGIPPDIAEKRFAPFFITEPDGMGMGLSICRSIVEVHHGRLWFEAADGGGTAFIL